jgi:hypothetical protein
MLEFEHRPGETCGLEREREMLSKSIDVVLTYRTLDST